MKVLAIASAGGHWIQLLRLFPAIENDEVIYLSTKKSFADTVKGHRFIHIPDASRWNKLKLIYMAFCVAKAVIRYNPNVVITTGAAPGLMGMIAGKLLGKKTIWVDSIANVEKISLSGRIALYFADKVYTQWPKLETKEIHYKGNVLS